MRVVASVERIDVLRLRLAAPETRAAEPAPVKMIELPPGTASNVAVAVAVAVVVAEQNNDSGVIKGFADVAMPMEQVRMGSKMSMNHGVVEKHVNVLQGVLAVGLVAMMVAEAMAAAAGFGKPVVGKQWAGPTESLIVEAHAAAKVAAAAVAN